MKRWSGTATVSTTIGAEGLDVSHPGNVRLADTPDAFAEQCVTLLQDSRQRETTAAAALELVSSRFSWDVVAAGFEELLTLGKPIGHASPCCQLR
jgi:glycosyltransferase involved in cell wall biosynthesis